MESRPQRGKVPDAEGGNIVEKGKFLERQKRLGPGLKGKEGLLFHCNRKGTVQTQVQS